MDFEGLEYGEYSKKDKGVVVTIAVPNCMLAGGDLGRFVVNSLYGVNAMAFEFFRQEGEEFPLRKAEEWVTEVASQLGAVSAQ